MEEAVAICRAEAQAGDIVSLSPASASFDLYANSVERCVFPSAWSTRSNNTILIYRISFIQIVLNCVFSMEIAVFLQAVQIRPMLITIRNI